MTYAAADLERVFAEQLRAVAGALSALNADFMLIGGLAVGVWGEPRGTKDADFSVHVATSADDLRSGLAATGLQVSGGDLARAVAQAGSVRLRRTDHQDDPIAVDLLVATTPFEIDALSRRRPVRVLGVDLPVVAPEDLFVFNLIAGRPQDLADAALLHELHGEAFNLPRVRRWCAEFRVEDRLTSFVSSAGRP